MTICDVKVTSLDMTLGDQESVLHISVPCESWMHFNNVPSPRYDKITEFSFPQVRIRLLHSVCKNLKFWMEVARLDLDCGCERIAISKNGSRSFLRKEFVYNQDQATKRANEIFKLLGQRKDAGGLYHSQEDIGDGECPPLSESSIPFVDYLPFLAVYVKRKKTAQGKMLDFLKVKDSHPMCRKGKAAAEKLNVEYSESQIGGNNGDKIDSTALCIAINSLDGLFTPLAAGDFEQILSSYCAQWPGPELLLDELLSAFVSESNSSEDPQSSSTEIRIRNMSVNLMTCNTIAPSKLRSLDSSCKPLLKLTLEHFTALFHNSRHGRNSSRPLLAINAPRFRADLLTIPPGYSESQSPNLTALVIEDFYLTYSISMVYLTFPVVRFSLTHGAPLYGISLVSEFLGPFSKLGSTIAQFKKLLVHRKRSLLLEVLDRSHLKAILNPLSSAKGSYLADSQKLRFDVSYNMLTYLRLCLATFNVEERKNLLSVSVDINKTVLQIGRAHV